MDPNRLSHPTIHQLPCGAPPSVYHDDHGVSRAHTPTITGSLPQIARGANGHHLAGRVSFGVDLPQLVQSHLPMWTHRPPVQHCILMPAPFRTHQTRRAQRLMPTMSPSIVLLANCIQFALAMVGKRKQHLLCSHTHTPTFPTTAGSFVQASENPSTYPTQYTRLAAPFTVRSTHTPPQPLSPTRTITSTSHAATFTKKKHSRSASSDAPSSPSKRARAAEPPANEPHTKLSDKPSNKPTNITPFQPTPWSPYPPSKPGTPASCALADWLGIREAVASEIVSEWKMFVESPGARVGEGWKRLQYAADAHRYGIEKFPEAYDLLGLAAWQFALEREIDAERRQRGEMVQEDPILEEPRSRVCHCVLGTPRPICGLSPYQTCPAPMQPTGQIGPAWSMSYSFPTRGVWAPSPDHIHAPPSSISRVSGAARMAPRTVSAAWGPPAPSHPSYQVSSVPVWPAGVPPASANAQFQGPSAAVLARRSMRR